MRKREKRVRRTKYSKKAVWLWKRDEEKRKEAVSINNKFDKKGKLLCNSDNESSIFGWSRKEISPKKKEGKQKVSKGAGQRGRESSKRTQFNWKKMYKIN